MNLERHLRVLWRRRFLVASGVLLAAALAFLTAYDVSGGHPKRRGSEVWSSSSQILVTQKGFPWGRVTLPDASLDGKTATNPSDLSAQDRIRYADPTRFVNLALLYSVISHSDDVRSRLPGNPNPDQIQTTLLDPTNSGNSYLPIIQLTTRASTPGQATVLNSQTFDGLRSLLTDQQKSNGISGANRVLLTVLSQPSAPVIVEGRSMTSSILAFMLVIIATVAFAHIAEAISMARSRRATAEAGTEGAWTIDPTGVAQDPAGADGVDVSTHRGDPLVVGASHSADRS
jgi:hypothetical protein